MPSEIRTTRMLVEVEVDLPSDEDAAEVVAANLRGMTLVRTASFSRSTKVAVGVVATARVLPPDAG